MDDTGVQRLSKIHLDTPTYGAETGTLMDTVGQLSNTPETLLCDHTMTSIQDAVQRAIEEDFVLRDALARQVANRRGVARWLIEHKGIDSTVANVAHILKGYEGKQPASNLEGAWSVIDQVDISLAGGMAAVVVNKEPATVKKLRSAIAETEVDRDGVLRFSPTRTTFSLIYEARDDDAIRALFDDDQIIATYQDLSELLIHGPEDAIETPGILALITSALSAKGIPVLFPSHGSPELFLLIPADDGAEALNTLQDLTEPMTANGTTRV